MRYLQANYVNFSQRSLSSPKRERISDITSLVWPSISIIDSHFLHFAFQMELKTSKGHCQSVAGDHCRVSNVKKYGHWSKYVISNTTARIL